MLLFRVKHENWIITELSKLKNKWSKIQSRKVCISLVSHVGVELPKKKKMQAYKKKSSLGRDWSCFLKRTTW